MISSKHGLLIGSALASIAWSPAYADVLQGSGPVAEISEIIVTAQKREERLQDVPLPVTAIDSRTMLNRSQVRLEDYFTTVPSFNFTSNGNGQSSISIRGVTTGQGTNPAVGVVIDDVPYGSSTYVGYGTRILPDIDPGILERVEVLRGPQGTLYGASSIGGLLKFVTADPSSSGISGRLQADLNDVSHGDAGYGLRGSVNLPVTETIAVRAAAFYRQQGGYVDNVTTGEDDVNRTDAYGAHLIALWRPSSNTSLKLSALLQDTKGHGSSLVEGNYLLAPTIGDLKQRFSPNTGEYRINVRLYSATLNQSFGSVDLTSITGYGVNTYTGSIDQTLLRSEASQFYFGVRNATFTNDFETKKFSQELRLASNGDHFIDWTIGGFYTDERSDALQTLQAIDETTGARAGYLYYIPFPSTVREGAAFGSVTVNFTDKFDLQVGGRYSKNRQTYKENDSGAFYPIPVSISARSSDEAFTFQVTPRYRFSEDLMVYARVASGYRIGGPNPGVAYGLPTTFKNDTTINYEVGVKGTTPNRLMTYDVSAFYVDWRDIQIAARDPNTGFVYYINGGKASSQGVEGSATLRPWTGMRVTASGAFNDAKLVDPLPPNTSAGAKGDRLPYSNRFSGALLVDQDFDISDNVTGFVGATISHVGTRRGEIPRASAQVRVTFPEYTTVDLRGGVRFDDWTISGYVINAGDKRGILGGGSQLTTNSLTAPYAISYIRPRTIGMTVSRDF